MLIVTAVAVLALSTLIYASAEILPGVLAGYKTGNLLDKDVAANKFSIAEIPELSEEQIISIVEKADSKTDMRKFLQSKGYYEDEINISMRKHTQLMVIQGMTPDESDYLVQLVTQGYDYEKLLDIYNFICLTDKDVSIMCDIYDKADFDDEKFWLENAYDSVTENDSLSLEDIYYYTDKEISANDILSAYELSLRGVKTIHEILDEKISGISWAEIAAQVYGVSAEKAAAFDEAADLSAIVAIGNLARRLGISVENTLDLQSDNHISKAAIDAYSNKLQQVESIQAKLQLVPPTDEKIINIIKREVPELETQKIKELVEQGYRMRDIKAAVDDKAENLSIKSGEVRSLLYADNSREVLQ